MADANGDSSWRTQQYRQKVIAQIEEVMLRAGNPTNKSPQEMESHVFQKAKTREEYLGLVARVILHIREYNQKKNPGALPLSVPGGLPLGPAGVSVGLVPTGMPGPGGAQGSMVHDPLSALTSLSNIKPPQVQPGQRPPFQTYGGPGGAAGVTIRPSGPTGQTSGPASPWHARITHSLASLLAEPVTAPTLQTSLPSPLSAQTSSGPSPGGFAPSPSPQGAPLDPSPRQLAPVPSPGQVNLNTPGNPGSVERTAEEQAYLDKWRQLQKYIEPLKRMINRLTEDDSKERAGDLNKMKTLHDILSDSTKRLPMTTLLKCEAVLEKLDLQSKHHPPPSTPKPEEPAAGLQPLLSTLASQMTSSLLNHSLQRTFSHACSALHGQPIRAPSPPPKRRKSEPESPLSPLLMGEIARLDPRFLVRLDPLFHGGSKSVHLLCSLEDACLPTVPPLAVTVPQTYPELSPACTTHDYDMTPMLQYVERRLSGQLLALPGRFSLTQLLHTWEMSVRQACAPRVK